MIAIDLSVSSSESSHSACADGTVARLIACATWWMYRFLDLDSNRLNGTIHVTISGLTALWCVMVYRHAGSVLAGTICVMKLVG